MSLPASLPHIPVLLNKKTLNIAVMYCNKALWHSMYCPGSPPPPCHTTRWQWLVRMLETQRSWLCTKQAIFLAVPLPLPASLLARAPLLLCALKRPLRTLSLALPPSNLRLSKDDETE